MGFSGNVEPSYIIPTCIGINDSVAAGARRGSALEDMDFAIGHEALANASSHTVTWPIRHGQVENWDHMERYWQQCMFKCVAPRAAASRSPPLHPGFADVPLRRAAPAGTCAATPKTTSCCSRSRR